MVVAERLEEAHCPRPQANELLAVDGLLCPGTEVLTSAAPFPPVPPPCASLEQPASLSLIWTVDPPSTFARNRHEEHESAVSWDDTGFSSPYHGKRQTVCLREEEAFF